MTVPTRFALAFASGVLLVAATVGAADPTASLTLPESQRLALQSQPQLVAQEAEIRARLDRAVSMAQLPDPQLTAGVQNLPVEGSGKFGLRSEEMTMLTAGVMQEFPLGSKRELRGEKERLMAAGAQSQLDEVKLRIRRDAGLAWLEVYFPERAAELATAMLTEAERSRDAAEIAYRAGRVEQADVLASTVSAALIEDKIAEYRQMAARARRELARWIGSSADRPLGNELPALPKPPSLDQLLANIPRHPALQMAERTRDAAQTDLSLAKAAYKPDWRVEAGYGSRADFPDMVMLQVGIDLPFFTGNRQDREAAAARADIEQADAKRDDMLRELTAQASIALRDSEAVEARLARFDAAVLPPARSRIDAALAAYAAGRGTLLTLLDARRMYLDAQIERLTLAVDAARNRIGVQYFTQQESP